MRTVIFLLLSISLSAQTKVSIKSYIASKNIVLIKDTTVVIRDGYADYNINTPRSGIYTFTFNCLNGDGVTGTLSISNSTGAVLSKINVAVNPKWQKVTLSPNIAAAGATTKIRVSAVSGITMGSFYYSTPAAPPKPAPTPAPVPAPIPSPTLPNLNFDSLMKAVLVKLPELNLQGFEGDGVSSAILNKPKEYTKQQKDTLKVSRGTIIYQLPDPTAPEGLYYKRADGTWKYIN